LAWSLIPRIAQDFIGKLRSGEINPESLNAMTSAERHKYFADFMGEENAAKTNAMFESKLLLKNQQQGFITWAKQISGLKESAKKDLVSKIQKLDRVLNPADQQAFMADLAAQKMGVSITSEEAATISKLAKAASDSKADALSGKDRMTHGLALVDLQRYVGGLTEGAKSLKLSDFKTNPIGSSWEAAKGVAGLAKSLKVAGQFGAFIIRHGYKVGVNHPIIYFRNIAEAIKTGFYTLGGKDMMRLVDAHILSRDNAMNGLYKKEGLAVNTGLQEEFLPTSVQNKIPVVGRILKANHDMFTAFQRLSRADIFDAIVDKVQKAGGDIRGAGLIANMLTDRGDLGFAERYADGLNKVFFSPRLAKSNIDMLTGGVLNYGKMSPAIRRIAAMNSIRTIGAIASILAIANAIKPGSVETNPASSDFGKIKIGNTTFDFTAGAPGYVTLAVRMIPHINGTPFGTTKSASTGQTKILNSGKYGSRTRGDVFLEFLSNKLSPAAGFAKDYYFTGKDHDGNEATIGGAIKNAFSPMAASSYDELKKMPDASDAEIMAGLILDQMGVGIRTQEPPTFVEALEKNSPNSPVMKEIIRVSDETQDPVKFTNWDHSSNKVMSQFKQSVGEKGYQEAKAFYQQSLAQRLDDVVGDEDYQNADLLTQHKMLNSVDHKALKETFDQYDFNYQKPGQE